MVGLEELERLSRFAAGEVSDSDAAEIRAELQRRPELSHALEQLRFLEGAARALPPTLDETRADALVARTLAPRARLSKAWALMGLASTAAAVIALIWIAARGKESFRLIALDGRVSLNGELLASPSKPVDVLEDAVVQTEVEGSAVIEGRATSLFLPRGSSLALFRGPGKGTFELSRGTVVASGEQVLLAAGGARVELSGSAALSWEPEDILLRVTEVMDTTKPKPGTKAPFKWLKLPVAATAVAGGVVSLLVFDGRAKVSPASDPAVVVTAGEKWSSSSPGVSAISSRPAALRTNREDASSSAAVAPSATSSGAATGENLSRAELMAEVRRLRAENASLVERSGQLSKKASELDRTKQWEKNSYRMDPDELQVSAEEGRLRIRLPALSEGRLSYGREARDELGLQPNEEAAIREIYARSTQRVREGLVSLYREVGGDANTAIALNPDSLLTELRNLSRPGENADAVRQVARERAGLARPGAEQGSALLRAYRLLRQEDDRVLDELDALLGPARAEQLVNHRKTSHNNNSTTVGPGR